MFEVGQICVKLAGKDAGKTVVIVENVDHNFVVIDGPVKRKRCNIDHLEPIGKTMDIKEKASHEQVIKAFEKAGMPVAARKPKKAAARPKRQVRVKEKKQEKKPTKEKKKAEAPKKK